MGGSSSKDQSVTDHLRDQAKFIKRVQEYLQKLDKMFAEWEKSHRAMSRAIDSFFLPGSTYRDPAVGIIQRMKIFEQARLDLQPQIASVERAASDLLKKAKSLERLMKERDELSRKVTACSQRVDKLKKRELRNPSSAKLQSNVHEAENKLSAVTSQFKLKELEAQFETSNAMNTKFLDASMLVNRSVLIAIHFLRLTAPEMEKAEPFLTFLQQSQYGGGGGGPQQHAKSPEESLTPGYNTGSPAPPIVSSLCSAPPPPPPPAVLLPSSSAGAGCGGGGEPTCQQTSYNPAGGERGCSSPSPYSPPPPPPPVQSQQHASSYSPHTPAMSANHPTNVSPPYVAPSPYTLPHQQSGHSYSDANNPQHFLSSSSSASRGLSPAEPDATAAAAGGGGGGRHDSRTTTPLITFSPYSIHQGGNQQGGISSSCSSPVVGVAKNGSSPQHQQEMLLSNQEGNLGGRKGEGGGGLLFSSQSSSPQNRSEGKGGGGEGATGEEGVKEKASLNLSSFRPVFSSGGDVEKKTAGVSLYDNTNSHSDYLDRGGELGEQHKTNAAALSSSYHSQQKEDSRANNVESNPFDSD